MEGNALTSQLTGWLPFMLIFVVWLVYTRRIAARQGSMAEIGRENTEAVRQNTEALKAVLAKLESQSEK
ncbi:MULTISPECIES: hypothetical protein [unclassified Mesorhizobium]|uniref:hypothetical protein n=1 Tax=unclassified Mesorhizobium TaxID=325217 RepID=UPI000BB0C166|nr:MULTISPECIES: hypothetical protein [unclassified Mesorhizobium]AZO08132.1 hypothetical protein EJ074_02580 [Mesorhizobium sp. M3A.F.Ca.ET.080.04.2.1]PBB85797.1 hypothetical protein CK216_16900 [Mesorhizobium sp. WSM3876]RWB70888.1 MAG: hypothetical protein EOQ49_16330 [Mesorhizobium sp.]RWB89123.1 MAG: hypothetical protein EOQ52_12110 [Mesorhizobium sp.]RWE23848.1 MAG: hypothetical protein EOS41_19055 [Mesorhizobium sp.]